MVETALSAENQDALDDLLVAIEAGGRRLGIFIAVCDDPLLREEIIAQYEQALAPEFRHYSLRLNPEEPSLRAVVAQQVAADEYLQVGGKAVMTVLGAEQLLTFKLEEPQSQQEAFFGYLQWTREGLQELPFAIVLWVTYQLQEQLSRKAPDFWSWRRDVIRFVSPKRQAVSVDELPVLNRFEQFADSGELGNTVPIADLEALIESLETKDSESPLLASLHSQVGCAYLARVERGRSQEYTEEIEVARGHLNKALQLLSQSEEPREYARSLDKLGRSYQLQGRYSEAEPLFLQALEIRKTELGDRHPSTATSLNNLAELYESQGRYSEAEPLLVQALEIRKAELGDRHPSTASSLNNLAELYRSQGRYSEAEPLYVQALEIYKAELGDRHPSTASSLNNLALLYDSQGRYSEAEPLYVQALEISKAELGDRHPSTATSLNNLAALYESQGRYSDAEPLLVQALELSKAELGDHHPSTASSLNNLAALYRSQGRYGEAEPLYVQALEIRKAELGDRHPDTAGSLFNLAVLYYQTERSSQALPLIQQAIAIYTDVLGTEHPNTQSALSWLPDIEAAVNSPTLPKWFPFKRLLHQLAQRFNQ